MKGNKKHWTHAVHKAMVFMLFKSKGDMQSLDKYRGICLLSMISRVLERLAISRCLKYLESWPFLNEQWGFRWKKSTRDVILTNARVEQGVAQGSYGKSWHVRTKAECGEAEDKTFKETQPMLYLGDIKRPFPSSPEQPLWDEGSLLASWQFSVDSTPTLRTACDKAGDSEATFKRGLREGCALSCTLNNVFHIFALEERNKVTPGISLRCSPSLRCSGRETSPATTVEEALHKLRECWENVESQCTREMSS